MKKICIILLGLLPFGVLAQEKGTWSVSTHLQSEHALDAQMSNDLYYPMVIEPMTFKRLHFTTGFGLNYRLANNLEFSSGIRYSRKKEVFGNYIFPGCFVGSQQLIYAPVTRQFIEIPVLARYYFLPGKIKLHVESGGVASYQLQTANHSKFTTMVLSPQTGIGIDLFLNRWQFALGANYRMQFEFGDRSSNFNLARHALGIEFKTAFSLNN